MKDLLRREVQQLRKTFDFFNERLDFNRKTWWCDERLIFFFKERLDNNSERLDDLMKLRKTSFSSTKDLMTSWKTGLKGTLKSYGDFFFFNKRLDDLMKDMFEGNFKNLEGLLLTWWKTGLKWTSKSWGDFFFFNKRVDELMKDMFEGNFKNLEGLLLLL